ncbi:hypothetical protein llap_9731 [Limosa lapponica baueri]|uniref:Uncharacterized protein n=1 Tax=Limosa lapponica baueri TaxID=1758121 RepID=A0A2I0U1Z3_LIMLA|nr:hypothetical protein llap_9731 [Limosa lapponica baueri]
MWRGIQHTWNRWKHSPTICQGLIQTALEKGDVPEHLQYITDIIVWGNKAEVFAKGKRVIQILLKPGFAIKRSKVKGPAQEMQFLGIKWQDGRHHVPTDVVNKIANMSPPMYPLLGKPNHPRILEESMDWPKGTNFGALPEEVARA